MDSIENGKLLLFKNKEKVFKYYFLEDVIILFVLDLIEWGVDIFCTKTFVWWEIPLDIALTVVIALVAARLQVRWNRYYKQENTYFKEKYGSKKN